MFSQDGRTPLHLLCLSPDANLKMISEIINAGADINAKDKVSMHS